MAAMRDEDGSGPIRVVGKRRAPSRMLQSGRDAVADVIAWRRAFPTPFVPRGVYRFKTHHEADEWLWKKITRPTNR